MKTQRRKLLLILACLALLSLAAILALPGSAGIPFWGVHTVMALGMLPLIFAVMGYFVPVLTRTGSEGRAMVALPLLAMAGGASAVLGMVAAPAWIYAGAGLELGVTLAMLGWMRSRVALALGAPHPGLAWYRAALIFLVLGLMAVLVGGGWPEQWPALRRLHLHFNLLGFVGLTAIGTLQVLLPTAAGYADPGVSQRLRAGLKYAIAGTLLIGAGAAWFPLLVWPGLLLWLPPVVPFLRVLRRHAHKVRHGAAVALASWLMGYILVLASGLLHGLGVLAPRQSVALFFVVFLLPLVTGAVSYLLPLWLLPAADNARHTRMRKFLARGSLARAMIFPASGLLLLAGVSWAVYPAVAILVLFIGQILAAVTRATSPRI